MATITTDVYLDDASRSAGEAMTINGGSLTVRTDSRVHSGAPASMTGSIGSVSISSTLGGRYILDGTKVRWLPFSGGTGNVPEIGTTITGSTSGANGYLLGVWESLTSAPSAVGSAMPASGFIKLREADAAYISGEALVGIGATTSDVDEPGWIEVVHDQNIAITVPRLGDFTVRGNPSMFKIGTTNGSANQLMQVPTNGSTTTYVPGVFVEDMKLSISSMSWSNGTVTLSWPSHGFETEYDLDGNVVGAPTIIIEGSNPSGYNGAHRVAIVDADTLSFPLDSDPGTYVSGATALHFEFYPAIFAAGMIPTNLGTDARSKFVCMETNGQIRFGHNGTNVVGYVPPAGKSVRVPNVFGRQCTTTTRETNEIPHATLGTRPDFNTNSAGKIDIQNFMTDWYISFSQPYMVSIVDSCIFDVVIVSECASAVNISNGGTGISQSLSQKSISLTSCFAGGEITDWICYRYSATNNACESIYSARQTYTRVKSGIVQYARSSTAVFQITQSNGIKFNDCYTVNQGVQFNTGLNCKIDGFDYCDRFVGTTNTTSGISSFRAGASNNIEIRDITFGLKGTIENVHPHFYIFSIGQSTNIKIRECGSRSAFLSGGTVNSSAYIFSSSGNNSNFKLQRIYVAPTRVGAINTINSDKNMLYEHVYGDMTDTMTLASLNSIVRNCGGTHSTTGQSSVYGTHFKDAFTSDTTGQVMLAFNEPTAETAQYVNIVSGNPRFTSAGSLTMQSVGDEIIIEQSYFVKGCTALANTAPVITGTNVTYSSGARWGNHDIYYQIDVNDGNGWNGSWKALTAANLSSETINPTNGFKFKFRIVCATANTGNLLVYIRINTISTLDAQINNLYPLDTITLKLTGLVSGSDIVILAAGTETERVNVDANPSTIYNYVYETVENVDICVYKHGYIPFIIRNYPLPSSGGSLPIAQIPDRNFLE